MEVSLTKLSQERPVGTERNAELNDWLEEQLASLGYKIDSLPFDCYTWQFGPSWGNVGSLVFPVLPCPFSEGFSGTGRLAHASTLTELDDLNCSGAVLLMSGTLTESPLMPKDYPFYYPDEHRRIIDLLERKAPLAILALTGKHPMCGLDPFPLFEDGNFSIPVAYASQSMMGDLEGFLGDTMKLTIDSRKIPAKSRQLVATSYNEYTKRKVVLCAHMDTKYQTPGALDNASGVAVLLEAAKILMHVGIPADIVPFNGEEYYGACGELAYMNYLRQHGESVELLVNMDSPCYLDHPAAASLYNLNDKKKAIAERILAESPEMMLGEPWYAGDHAAFAFSGTPCIAVTAGDLAGALALTHTQQDTSEIVNTAKIAPVAAAVVALVTALIEKESPRDP